MSNFTCHLPKIKLYLCSQFTHKLLLLLAEPCIRTKEAHPPIVNVFNDINTEKENQET